MKIITGFLKFWFYEAPAEMMAVFRSFNGYFIELFAYRLSLVTFFKPLKNEYRAGLVGFSRTIGILTKICILTVDTVIFLLILAIEAILLLFFIFYPVLTVLFLFI